MSRVALKQINSGMKSSLNELINLIGGLDEFLNHDDVVLLKPNINGKEGVTNIKLVKSLIELLLDFKVKKIVIGEATFGNSQMTDVYFEKSGYADLAKKYEIELINFNDSSIKKVKVDNPLILNEIKIAEEVFDVDKIINMPIMKVHYATGITLAMKNLKGLLVGDEKMHFHESGLDKSIADLNKVIKPELHIVDCISCMEGMGPRGGEMVELDLIMAGEDSATVDYVGSKIMGYELEEIKHLSYYINENDIDIENINVVGEKIKDVQYDFDKANIDIEIPSNIEVKNINACSSCMNALILSCRFLENEIQEKIQVYLGSKYEEDNNCTKKIAFGNCCGDNEYFDEQIKGCPPFPLKLKEIINIF